MANGALITSETICFVLLFFANLIFLQKKLFHVYWLGLLNIIIFYLAFFLRKLFLAYSSKAVKTTLHCVLYTLFKISSIGYLDDDRLLQFKCYLHFLIEILNLKHISS